MLAPGPASDEIGKVPDFDTSDHSRTKRARGEGGSGPFPIITEREQL